MNDFIRWALGIALMASPMASGPIVERIIRSSGNLPLPGEVSLLAFLLVFGLGLAGVVMLPLRRRARLVSGALYLPVVAVIYAVWMLAFVCHSYGECL